MGDVKSRLQQLRERGPAAPDPQPAAVPDTPAVSARAARFASQEDEVPDLDEPHAPDQAAAAAVPDRSDPTPAPPQARSSRAERFGAPAPRPPAPAAAPASLRDWRRGRREAPPPEADDGGEAGKAVASAPAEPWTDPNRPAGSAYSAEEWDAAQAANPDCIIVEIHKPQEKGLLAIERSTLDAMRQTFLHRTLLVDERVASGHAYPDEVCGRVEHRTESFGLFRYRLMRAACQDEVAAKHGYHGAVLRNWEYEPGSGQRSPAPEEVRSERAQRFGERSRG